MEVFVMKTRKQLLGINHSATIKSMQHLAATYQAQKRENEAQKLDNIIKEHHGAALKEVNESSITRS